MIRQTVSKNNSEEKEENFANIDAENIGLGVAVSEKKRKRTLGRLKKVVNVKYITKNEQKEPENDNL